MDYFHLVAYITASTVLIPLVLVLIQWKKISHDISALRWLLIASLITDLSGISMALMSIENDWVGSVYLFMQFILLLYIFSSQFTGKILFVIVAVVITLLYATNFLFREYPIAELGHSGVVDGLILIVVSIAFFYKLLNELKVVHIHRLPILWIAFATLFYYSGNLFVFLASSYLIKDVESFTLTWTLHNILNVVKNILFAVGLWQSYKTLRINEQ